MKTRLLIFTGVIIIMPLMLSCSGNNNRSRAEAGNILNMAGVRNGLIVHLDCGDGSLTAALKTTDNCIVHGLSRDVETSRNNIQNLGVYGPVSVERMNEQVLPYSDNMVNLVVAEGPVNVPMEEIMRVLAPGGVFCRKENSQWVQTVKPQPDDTDEWTHYLHDSQGNPVGEGTQIGPPQHLQWLGGPNWNRHSKTSGIVSASGRLFYIMDAAYTRETEADWSLIARDAYNGIILWKKSLTEWWGGGYKKMGPLNVHRKLVASDNHVYATLGSHAPVSVLDAASGELIRDLDKTASTEEMIFSNGILIALVNRNPKPDGNVDLIKHSYLLEVIPQEKQLVACDPQTGKLLWEHAAGLVMPLSLAADAKQAVYHNGQKVVSLDLKTGEKRWESLPTGQIIQYRPATNNGYGPVNEEEDKNVLILTPEIGPTLVMYKNVVVYAGGGQMNVISAETGTDLWKGECPEYGYRVPADVFGMKDLVWTISAKTLDATGRDPNTGKVIEEINGSPGPSFPHHRCYRMKAVTNTILSSSAGIEFIDLISGTTSQHHWVRGSCYSGIMPSNGYVYVPPHNCACYIRGKLNGFLALRSGGHQTEAMPDKSPRLVRGPAFGKVKPTETTENDWPTYRKDIARSGKTTDMINGMLKLAWKRQFRGELSSPVSAAGRVCFSDIEAHSVYAVHAGNGKTLWQFTAGGRVDSPPTLYRGMVLFGCRDGHVYALRETDGMLVWQFRATLGNRLIVSKGQLESVWPVHGSVIVVNDTLYFAAGRNSYLDGGIYLYGLDPGTGKELVSNRIYTRKEDGSQISDGSRSIAGNLVDILSSDGTHLFMRHQVLDLNCRMTDRQINHLHSPAGYLDDEFNLRTYFIYGPQYTSLAVGTADYDLARFVYPSGRILVEDENFLFGYDHDGVYFYEPSVIPTLKNKLFSVHKDSVRERDAISRIPKTSRTVVQKNWSCDIPVKVWAMAIAGDKIILAGEESLNSIPDVNSGGEARSLAMVFDSKNGKTLSIYALSSPARWDGIAVADGSVYISSRKGELICLRSE